VFDGDPQARAKDRDRDRAVYVVDAARRNGQITQQDRDLRVERARAAHTIGELETLTHDIASSPAPLPPTAVVPPPAAPAAPTTPVAGVPADLYGPSPTATTTLAGGTGLTTKTNPAGRRIAIGCGAVGLLFFIVPIVFGVVVFALQSGGDTAIGEETGPIPAGPPFELSGAGLRQYLAAFEETFDDTEVVRTVFYDEYVLSWVPQDDGNVVTWNYVDGAFTQLGEPMEDVVDTAPVDLADLKPAKVMSLVREARATLLVDEPATTYVIYDRNVIDSTPQVMVYLTNDEGQNGYLIGDLDGNVVSTTAAE
jgi:hypothetical protein